MPEDKFIQISQLLDVSKTLVTLPQKGAEKKSKYINLKIMELQQLCGLSLSHFEE